MREVVRVLDSKGYDEGIGMRGAIYKELRDIEISTMSTTGSTSDNADLKIIERSWWEWQWKSWWRVSRKGRAIQREGTNPNLMVLRKHITNTHRILYHLTTLQKSHMYIWFATKRNVLKTWFWPTCRDLALWWTTQYPIISLLIPFLWKFQHKYMNQNSILIT